MLSIFAAHRMPPVYGFVNGEQVDRDPTTEQSCFAGWPPVTRSPITPTHISASTRALDELLTAYEREGVRWIDLPTALADPFYAIDPDLATAAGAALPYLLLKAREGEALTLPARPRRGLVEALDAVCRPPPTAPS